MIKLRNLVLIVADAKPMIKHIAGDTVIDINTTEYKSSSIDTDNDTENSSFVFINIKGKVYIEGNRLMVIPHDTV